MSFGKRLALHVAEGGYVLVTVYVLIEESSFGLAGEKYVLEEMGVGCLVDLEKAPGLMARQEAYVGDFHAA